MGADAGGSVRISGFGKSGAWAALFSCAAVWGAFLCSALLSGQGVLRCFEFLCFRVAFAARSCAACTGCSSHVAASGGQGGPGGLRVPPTPSLDSLLTPLYRRRSAGGWRRRGAAFFCSAPPWCKGRVCCSAFYRCFAAFAAALLRRLWLRQQPCGSLRRPRRDRGIAISP